VGVAVGWVDVVEILLFVELSLFGSAVAACAEGVPSITNKITVTEAIKKRNPVFMKVPRQ
jgi:hypothetical protein